VKCISQNNYSEVEFFRHVEYKDVTIYIYDTLGYKVIVPSYDFEISNLKIGDACLFAISKKYPEEWVKNAKKGECSKIEDDYFSLRCQAKLLFSSDTIFLRKSFDIYVFFIDKKELEGPFKEQTDEGYFDNYSPKKNSKVIVYKYDNDKWTEIRKLINPSGDSPRLIGEDYMEKLAKKRIKEYLIGR